MDRGAAPLEFSAEADHTRPSALRGRPGGWNPPLGLFALLKLHILYYLLSIIFYLLTFLVLAVVAGLGADVNIIAGQMGAQAHILALVADSQAQLVVGHGHAAALGLAGQQFDLDDLGRGQGRGDKLGDVLAPADDIDLLAVQLLDDLLDADAAGTDAGTDGIDIGFLLQTANLVRAPASRAMALTSTVPSKISGPPAQTYA